MKRNVFALISSAMLLAISVVAQEAAKPEAPKTEGTNAAAAATPQPAPKIQFDKTVYDFGNTSMVQQLTGTFTYQNAGEGVLDLKKPTTSCGCTVASVKPDSLKPGEKGELVFTMNVGNMNRGHAEKHITVPSNDPQTPSVNLTVKADIVPTFDYNPQQVPLGDIRQGLVTNIVVEVKRVDGKNINLTKVETSNPSIRAHIAPVESSEGKAAQVLIAFEAEGAPRRFNDNVKVYGDATNQPAFTIPVMGRLVGELSINPEAVFWGIADPEHWPGPRPELMTTRNVRVQATDPNKAMEVRNVTTSLKDVSVSINTVETGKVYEVVAKLTEAPKESERGTITFETTLVGLTNVVVPVTINVLKRN
jgi:hypothetical protein